MISMGSVVTFRRRKLTKDDLVRMRLPKRYWNVTCDRVSNKTTVESRGPRDILKNYVQNMEDMRARGIGILLWGANGTGKTSMAAIIAKEYRRRFNTVLFIEAASLKSLVVSKESFDEDETYWQRAMSVDVLVLDDLGKGTKDSTGFGERLIDELIRTRNANQLVTIITTNAVVQGKGEKIQDILKPSTLHSLKEHVLAIYVEGEDMREESVSEILRIVE